MNTTTVQGTGSTDIRDDYSVSNCIWTPQQCKIIFQDPLTKNSKLEKKVILKIIFLVVFFSSLCYWGRELWLTLFYLLTDKKVMKVMKIVFGLFNHKREGGSN